VTTSNNTPHRIDSDNRTETKPTTQEAQMTDRSDSESSQESSREEKSNEGSPKKSESESSAHEND
jgi:hypothetical protein